MKKISFLIAVLLMGLTACNDWLEEHPKAVAAETFYNTTGEADAAVLAPLKKIREGFMMNYPGILENFADYAYGRSSWAANSDYQGLNVQNQSRANSIWSGLYKSIRDCNIALQRLPNASEMTEAQINAYLGELRFIRAFDYFQIVRLWNGGPLRTEENMDEFNQPKADAATLYDFIVKDLLYAVEHAPDKARLVGTPCKNAAASLLSQVYLQLGKYEESFKYAKQVVDSGMYALVPVSQSSDFDNVFGANLQTSSEEIFYMKADNEPGIWDHGWEYPMFCSHPTAMINGEKMHGSGGWYGIYATSENELISKWDIKDLRKDFNLLKHDFGLGDQTYLLCKYHDPSPHAGNDFPLIRYPDILLVYAETAARLNNAPTADAMEKLNIIHRRAYGYDPNSPSEVDFKLADYATLDKFMDLLIQEQMYECFNEAKRWLFLQRLGIAKEQIKKIKGIDVADKHMLFPFPTTEFDYNEAMDPNTDQNPGY